MEQRVQVVRRQLPEPRGEHSRDVLTLMLDGIPETEEAVT
jgi:hypothetical protein